MLEYPNDIQEKLGMDQVIQLVRARCKSDHGVEFLEKVRPSSRVDDISKWLDQTNEMVRILSSGDNLPLYLKVRNPPIIIINSINKNKLINKVIYLSLKILIFFKL